MTLYEEWQDNNDRPAWIRSNSDRLREAVDMDSFEDTPDWASLRSIEEWLDDYRGVVTRALNPEGEDTSDGGTQEGGE